MEKTGPNRKLQTLGRGPTGSLRGMTKTSLPPRYIPLKKTKSRYVSNVWLGISTCTGYWVLLVGTKQHSRGKMPQWVEQLIKARTDDTDTQLIDTDKLDGEHAEPMEELETLQGNDEQKSSLLVG